MPSRKSWIGRTPWLIFLTAGLACGFALVGSTAAAPVTASVSQHARSNASCQPLQTFAQPLKGFNPMTASATQLRHYGLPPRPPGSNARAIAVWANAMRHAKHYSPPHPVCGTNAHTLEYSGNWAGHVVPGSVHSATYSWSQSTWVQPSVPSNSNYTNYQNAPDTSFWVGTGITSLIQAGADSISTSTPQYRFWTEDYPNNTVWEGPVIRPGDTAFVYEEYEGNSQAYYDLQNLTTGAYQTFVNAAPYNGYNAANFINERVNSYYLPRFANTPVSDDFYGNSSNTWQLTTSNNKWTMTTDCNSDGYVLSQPNGVDSSGDFNQIWFNSSPVCN
jgi:hypothetical protein